MFLPIVLFCYYWTILHIQKHKQLFFLPSFSSTAVGCADKGQRSTDLNFQCTLRRAIATQAVFLRNLNTPTFSGFATTLDRKRKGFCYQIHAKQNKLFISFLFSFIYIFPHIVRVLSWGVVQNCKINQSLLFSTVSHYKIICINTGPHCIRCKNHLRPWIVDLCIFEEVIVFSSLRQALDYFYLTIAECHPNTHTLSEPHWLFWSVWKQTDK